MKKNVSKMKVFAIKKIKKIFKGPCDLKAKTEEKKKIVFAFTMGKINLKEPKKI